MAHPDLAALRHLLNSLLAIFKNVEDASASYGESLKVLDLCSTPSESEPAAITLDEGSQENLYYHLTHCLNTTRLLKSDYHSQALCILADASREPKWRKDFAQCTSRATHPGWPPLLNQYGHENSKERLSEEPDCVLQVAVRTLHSRFIGKDGQAAYHAIRLVSNCCADNDTNKRSVLECGGIELLLRCVRSRLWPDVIATALWNICAECDDDASSKDLDGYDNNNLAARQEAVSQPDMASVAVSQLILRSTSEHDDIGGNDSLNLDDGNRQQDVNIVSDLLQLATLVTDQARREMVADLLEKASWHLTWPSNSSNVKQQQQALPERTRLIYAETRPQDFLSDLLEGPGRSLAMSDPECIRDIAQTIAVLASQPEVQRELISQDLMEAYLTVPNWASDDVEHVESVNLKSSMVKIRQSLSKTTYGLAASPDFAAKYGFNKDCSDLVIACINSLNDISGCQKPRPIFDQIPIASAVLILANLTKSKQDALLLVRRYGVHHSLCRLLREQDDSTILFPAMALLDRLAMPPENKASIHATGVLGGLTRFFTGFDVQPDIQREAVSALRNVIDGLLVRASDIGVCTHVTAEERVESTATEDSQVQSCLLAALYLFRRSEDVTVKLEVSRLVVEVCRTILHSTGGHPEQAEDTIRLVFGNADLVAQPLIFLVRQGLTKALRGEGWFALAILSTWECGRPIVIECMSDKGLQETADVVLEEQDQAFCQNIRLMLTKLRLFPSQRVEPSTRESLERIASAAALPAIWSEERE